MTEGNLDQWDRRGFLVLLGQGAQEEILGRLGLLEIRAQEVMQDRGVTLDHKVFRGFKVFVVILGRKVIRAVKVQKEILVHKDQSAQRAR